MTIKHKETLSEKLDRKIQEIKEQKIAIDELVTSQYEESKLVIGKRLIMKKEPHITFNFFFTGLYDCYDCSIHSKSVDINKEFEVTHNIKTSVSLPYKIKLENLAKLLIAWVGILVDCELQKEEMK